MMKQNSTTSSIQNSKLKIQNSPLGGSSKLIDIEAIKKEIIELLKPLNLEKIILFGSYAYGNPTEDSDIDLYVVTKDDFIPQSYDENMKIYLRIAAVMQDFLQKYPTDLLTHTKRMHEKFVALNSSFAKEIMKKGIKIL